MYSIRAGLCGLGELYFDIFNLLGDSAFCWLPRDCWFTCEDNKYFYFNANNESETTTIKRKPQTKSKWNDLHTKYTIWIAYGYTRKTRFIANLCKSWRIIKKNCNIIWCVCGCGLLLNTISIHTTYHWYHAIPNLGNINTRNVIILILLLLLLLLLLRVEERERVREEGEKKMKRKEEVLILHTARLCDIPLKKYKGKNTKKTRKAETKTTKWDGQRK